jgi:imidazole glycerol-phosphate synthase subunit HisH
VSVIVVDYGAGNLRSVAKALEEAQRLNGAWGEVVITSDPEAVARAERILLPGDGAFPDCKRGLMAVDGLLDALTEAVRVKKTPFLGICIGMQLLATSGVEFEETQGLGWIPGRVERVQPDDMALKVPHMGWNTLDVMREHPLLEGLPLGTAGLHAYFLHAFHLKALDPQHVIAVADYGGPITAAVAKDNIAGTQFHPEKSQQLGLLLLSNFLRWVP